MSYHLLTGATGLLGGYLLKDLLQANQSLAVVVRPSQQQSAHQRIDEVMAHWERLAGYSLPRPVVLVGDLVKPGLALNLCDIHWIAEHCTSVIHNAASLKFIGSDPGRDPWLTNLTGTQHVLDLCRSTGIRNFFHVSTAYVCGQRTGRVSEDDIDVGQSPANDYEASKRAAELLVAKSDWLSSTTVFRPSIIAGDSRSGFTTTYHGFYFPLKIGAWLASQGTDIAEFSMNEIFQLLELTGQERKNFVPVDWVSSVMAHIVQTPQLHGRTWHLTSGVPVPLHEMAQVMTDELRSGIRPSSIPQASESDAGVIASQFRMQMTAYRSYWRDDPEFCQQSTSNAVPHLPCPTVDSTTMRRWCRFAITQNFGQVNRDPLSAEKTTAQLQACQFRSEPGGQTLPVSSDAPNSSAPVSIINIQVNGTGGGQWQVRVSYEAIVDVRPGLSGSCDGLMYLNSHTFGRICRHELSAEEAIASGAILVEGHRPAAEILNQFIQFRRPKRSDDLVCSGSIEMQS